MALDEPALERICSGIAMILKNTKPEAVEQMLKFEVLGLLRAQNDSVRSRIGDLLDQRTHAYERNHREVPGFERTVTALSESASAARHAELPFDETF